VLPRLSFLAISHLLAALAGLTIGYHLWRKGTARVKLEAERLAAELARSESQAKDLSLVGAKLRNEQRMMTSLTRYLPGLVRELNRSDLDRRQIPELLYQLVDAIFEPEQFLLFLARSEGEALEFHLCKHHGLEKVPQGAGRVAMGAGKIGWVAENRVEMIADDWLNLTRTEGRTITDNHPLFRLDMIGPLVHHDQGEDHVLGVMCIGGPAMRPRDEKFMLQMVTNLGSIAITNTRNVGRLRDLANHDGLTSLLNKRHFMQRLGILIHEAEREAHPLGVFLFDIDHFKHYNDTNGHVAGDELLREMAKVLRDNIRPGDVAARYGGEEFVVAMPRSNRDVALQIAERIRAAVAGHPFESSSGQPGGMLTISGGVSAFPVDGTSSADLLRHADSALYRAKAGGRNAVRAYEGVTIGDQRASDSEPWATDTTSTTAR
jgi:diguanylate cyclase (GGDEF)-like protein